MKEKRYPIIIVVVIFSVILWFTVNMAYEYQATVDVPIDLQNIPDGKALRPPVQRYITFQVRGSGWQLAGLSFSPELRYVIDLNGVRRRKIIDVNRELNTRLRAPAGLELFDPEPDTAIVFLDTYAEKTVPVVSLVEIEIRPGYGQVGKMVMRPDKIRIGGAKSLIDKITSWPTKKERFTDVKSDLSLTVPISDSLRYEISRSEATVVIEVNVQPFAEKTFSGIPIEVSATPAKWEVILIPPKVDLIVRGGLDQLTNTTAEDFLATIDYRMILLDTTGNIQPEIVGPEGIEIIGRKPERFQYIKRRRL